MKHNTLQMMCLTLLLTLQTALAQDQSDRQLYERKCGRCHRVVEPEAVSTDAWPGILRSMRSRSALSDSEAETLTRYLVKHGGEGRVDGGIEEIALGGYLYTEYFQSPEKNRNFDLHYLAVHVSGWATERIEFLGEFELEHGGKGDNTFVEQAYMDFWFLPNLGLRIGAMLTPFNRFDERHDPLGNFLITRPQVSREISVSAWKEVGADLHGHLRFAGDQALHFDLYTINGMGSGANLRGSRQYRDNNEDLALGTRVSLILNDAVEIGGSVYRGAWDDAGKLELILGGVNCQLRSPVADVFAEYTRAQSENPEPAADGEMKGYFVEITRLIQEKFRPTLRLGALDYLDPGETGGRDPAKGNMDIKELSLGLAYYPAPGVVFKFEYTIFDEGDRVMERDNDQLGLQAALSF